MEKEHLHTAQNLSPTAKSFLMSFVICSDIVIVYVLTPYETEKDSKV